VSALESIMQHVYHLSVGIGPRGSCTPAEAEAARYTESVYRRLGLEPVVQPIVSARSAWSGYGAIAGLGLLAEAILLSSGRVGAYIALGLAVVAVVSLLLELYFTGNPVRWLLPRGRSQNVYAVIPPRGAVRKRLVMVGHLDTHRTPLVMRARGWLFVYRYITIAAFVGAIINLVLYLIISFGDVEGARLFTLGPSGALALALAMTLQADLTPHSAGANDNATGAAMVMGLAGRLLDEPLEHTEVWALNSGCEEVGCYGVHHFIRENREALGDAYFLAIDMVGGSDAHLNYVTNQALIYPFRSDTYLVELAGQVAAARPELGARGFKIIGGRTEGAMATKHGLRSLSIVNFSKEGIVPPHWHRADDTFENLDPDIVARTEVFTWELIRALDVSAQ
jgi:hypothetical protein